MAPNGELRWKPADEEGPQATLFSPGLRVVGKGEYRGLEFLEVDAKTIVNKVPGGPRFGFEYTINPYRGCSHACSYCFARPTHEYLGLGIGEDFDTKIVVKRNAIELARAETSPARWGGDLIAMGTNTDPYQPAEGKYRLTRGIVEALGERRNPISLLTKSSLVLRDIDVLTDAATRARVRVDFSVGTLDADVWRLTEPGTPHPMRRIEAMARLNEAGVPSGVLMGPIIPGLSDGEEQVRRVVDAAVDAGAVGVGHVVLHLGPGLRDHFLSWLQANRPDLVRRYVTWYRRGREADAVVRRRVATIVRDALAARGVPQRPPRSSRGDGTPREMTGDQLGLGI
jgi:DNA repair photolyase